MQNFLSKLKFKPRYFLFLIIAFGIFFRVYHHGDWIRFNADQSRDATIVSNYLEGRSSLPLLGPKAGGTEFKLGGAFYYLEIISAAIFGNSPDKMAYPDLFAGILTIPLIYLLTKRYFSSTVALILSFVASVSVYLIKYARFAWNPNSGPFYTLLFLLALLMLADEKVSKNFWWILIAGISLGIGVQLHTLMLAIMPMIAVFFFIYQRKKDSQILKKAVFIFAIAIVFNIGQIANEFNTGGSNIKAFLNGATSKTSRSNSLLGDILQVGACQIQSDAFIVSGFGDNDQCGTSLIVNGYNKSHGIMNELWWALELAASTAFTIGGIWFWIQAIKKEEKENKKLVLLLLGTYALIGFLLLIPLAKDLVTIRYYLAMTFVPFVLLGFWLKQILNWKNKKYAFGFIVVLITIFVFMNISQVKASFDDYANKKQIAGATKSEITLGETEFIANYILSHANPKSTVLVEGKQKYLFKYVRSIEYFTREKNLKVEPLSKKAIPAPNDIIVSIGNAKNKGKLSTKLAQTYSSKDARIYGRFSIVELITK